VVAAALVCLSCAAEPARVSQAPRTGQWVWTTADVARYTESVAEMPALEAGIYIGAIHCDTAAHRLEARAGLPPSVLTVAAPVAVIRFEDGLDRCRDVSDQSGRFASQLDSTVGVLRRRGGAVPYAAVQLDYDAPQRALRAWAASVRRLRAGALRGDSVWVTSLIAHLREREYGDWFGGVVTGHVLQVFDTGEPASETQVAEAIRITRRAGVAFRLGLGAFERETARGRTEHRAWFGTVRQFADVDGYQGVWVFPAGQRWISLLRERM
jgi:hypothetical protein